MPELNHPEISVRGNVTRNSKSWNKEHTISVQGEMRLERIEDGLNFWLPTAERGQMVILATVLDALHQEADAANEREIARQRAVQLAEMQQS